MSIIPLSLPWRFLSPNRHILQLLSDKEGVDIIVITLWFSPHRILYDVIGNTYEDGAGDTEVKSNMARSRGVISVSAN